MNTLIQIYNTLTTISTKGEDTLIMADCLRALRDYILNSQNQNKENEE